MINIYSLLVYIISFIGTLLVAYYLNGHPKNEEHKEDLGYILLVSLTPILNIVIFMYGLLLIVMLKYGYNLYTKLNKVFKHEKET